MRHNHIEQRRVERKLVPEVKEQILNLNRLGVRPRQILQELGPDCMLTQTQVTNFIQRSKDKGLLPKKLNVFDLYAWCQEHSVIPEDWDVPYVCKFDIERSNAPGPMFRFFVTTKRLVSLANKKPHWFIDATYKLNWNGFPVWIVGTTDAAKSFHPFGYALTVSEAEDDVLFVLQAVYNGYLILL